jgi:hypothetical protein
MIFVIIIYNPCAVEDIFSHHCQRMEEPTTPLSLTCAWLGNGVNFTVDIRLAQNIRINQQQF